MRFIQCNHISKTYGEGASAVTAIQRIGFVIERGEFVAVMGESGSGKSTLLSVMGAMNTPDSGRYVVDDIDVYALGSEKQADFRREYLGFVFQSFHLLPYLSVIENVMLPLTTTGKPSRTKYAMALEALTWVGLADKAARLPNQISGGEMERTAIARAIVNNPPILLADEPTGNLDSQNSKSVMDLLARLNQQGTTIVMVTHSETCARYAQRTIKLSDGRLLKEENLHSAGTRKAVA
ncbi:MAG: ABC transporter ATP-binding protein [Desulfobacteraceae bacterium]|nr:MAG: ABC transporter ATP-binding protein [Desulfobacteraceae bacterium]